jgi:hypothetical protein
MRETVSGQERIVLSVEHLARDQRLGQEPALLCENLNDCNFLTWLGSFYADWNGLPNRVRFEPRNGGGQTTAQTFEAILQGRNTLCLCIADSDLKYEGDNSLGATATALREANERSGTPLAHLHILCCQEAENLVPASVLEDLYSGDATKLASTSDIQQIQKDTAHELWRYYDVKNGIRVFQFLNPVRAQFQTSWSRVFGQASDVTKEYCRRCAELNICEEKSDCTTYLARGLGTTVLADTVESFFLKKSSAEILRRIPARMENDWSRIGRVLWTWGTAGPRMAAC